MKKTRVWAMVFFLLAVPVICFQLFVVRNFYPQMNAVFTKIWAGCLLLGWAALFIGDGRNYVVARRKLRQFVGQSRLKKRIL